MKWPRSSKKRFCKTIWIVERDVVVASRFGDGKSVMEYERC